MKKCILFVYLFMGVTVYNNKLTILFSFLLTARIITIRTHSLSCFNSKYFILFVSDMQRFSSAIALNDCDADQESPRHKVNSKSKHHLPKHGYKLIPMLSSFPKVHKGFMSPAKNNNSRRNSSNNLSSNPNCGGRRSSDFGDSSGSSPIVMSPAAAAARHQYRLVPDAELPSRIYKNPAAMTNSSTTNSKNKKLAANNKIFQMSMLARIT